MVAIPRPGVARPSCSSKTPCSSVRFMNAKRYGSESVSASSINNVERGRMKPVKVNRGEFLQRLELVRPGVATRELIEQSSCLVFQNGRVHTYNDEVACDHSSLLPESFTGVVPSEPLLNLLRKMGEDEIEISSTKKELVVAGSKKAGREAGIPLMKEVLLQVLTKKPKVWNKLEEAFADAIEIVHQCTANDEMKFMLTCVHIHPKWVEATDNIQMARYRLATGVESPVLVRSDAIQQMRGRGLVEIGTSKSWLHFRNPTGFHFACRKYVEEYINMSPYLKVEGQKVEFPKGLVEATERAEIFSAENAKENQVAIFLSPNRLEIRGLGVIGWYKERKKIRYTGEPMSFLVSPKLLMELVKRHNECVISNGVLKVDGGRFKYVTMLGNSSDDTEAEPEDNDKEEGDDSEGSDE